MVSAFPSQIAWLCRHPHLDAYDLTSVNVIVTGGSCLNATYERQIFDKIPNLLVLNIVILRSRSHTNINLSQPNPA